MEHLNMCSQGEAHDRAGMSHEGDAAMGKAVLEQFAPERMGVGMRNSSFSFPQIYMLSRMPYSLEYPYGHLWSAVTVVSSPSSLCIPSPLTCCEEQKRPDTA